MRWERWRCTDASRNQDKQKKQKTGRVNTKTKYGMRKCFFGLFHVIPNVHTRGFRAQTACMPPSLIPSQGATEVRKCDLNSSSKAAHPCCRRTTALFFLPLFLCFGSEYFWTSLLLVGRLDYFAFVRHTVLPALLWRAIANGMPEKRDLCTPETHLWGSAAWHLQLPGVRW